MAEAQSRQLDVGISGQQEGQLHLQRVLPPVGAVVEYGGRIPFHQHSREGRVKRLFTERRPPALVRRHRDLSACAGVVWAEDDDAPWNIQVAVELSSHRPGVDIAGVGGDAGEQLVAILLDIDELLELVLQRRGCAGIEGAGDRGFTKSGLHGVSLLQGRARTR